MKEEDRQRLHELLDYAIEHDENYVLMQFARLDLDWNTHLTRYRLHFKIEDETRNGIGPEGY